MRRPKEGRGLITAVLLIVVALIALGYFGYNLREILDSPLVRENLSYAWDLAVKLWNNFLATPVLWIWDKISGFLSRS